MVSTIQHIAVEYSVDSHGKCSRVDGIGRCKQMKSPPGRSILKRNHSQTIISIKGSADGEDVELLMLQISMGRISRNCFLDERIRKWDDRKAWAEKRDLCVERKSGWEMFQMFKGREE